MICLYLPDMKPYEIYDIQYDVLGRPSFLVYRDSKWTILDSIFFTPNYDGDDFSGYYVDDYGR